MFPNTFTDKETMAELAAKMLLEIKAVNFRADEPYTFASGLASPVLVGAAVARARSGAPQDATRGPGRR